MKLKRMISGLLSAALLCGMLMAVPATAASGSFTDIGDPMVAGAAETLRLLGVVSGDGTGAFYPGGTLTRAEFCAMAVLAMGKGAEADAQKNRTIFKDVGSTHWARGYVNFAASEPIGADSEGKGGDRLMIGKGDGNFYPNAPITYAEAVTAMLRILKYNSKVLTSGSTWYDGALAAAKTTGLADGVDLNYNSIITRGQTAILFENMLFTPEKDGKEPYLVTGLGGQILKEQVVLSLNATTADGTTGAVQTTGADDPYKTEGTFDRSVEGIRAKLVLDKEGNVVAIEPSKLGHGRSVTVATAEATYLTAVGGAKVTLTPTTPVYKNGKSYTYKDLYLDIKPSTQAVLYYATSGKLEYVFLPSADRAETAAVSLTGSGSDFAGLVGNETGYRVVKNGLPASMSAVKRYDVATYDKGTRTLFVSDLRLTGVFGDVYPSPVSPTEITVMGATFGVLPSAYESLAGFSVGDTITLLLTSDSQVAGVVSPNEARSTTVGVAEVKGRNATVTPLTDLRGIDGKKVTLSGETSLTEGMLAKFQGQLVTVSSGKTGQITLSRLSGSGADGALNVANRTVGGAKLAENVRIYERVGNSAPEEISLAQVTADSVPTNKIPYVGKDYAGRVNILVLDDATGDGYLYGKAKLEVVSENNTVSVEYADGKDSEPMVSGADIEKDSFIGIAPSLDKANEVSRLAGWVSLKAITKVPRSAFAMGEDAEGGKTPLGTVTAGGMQFPVAGNVVCYNKATGTWFDSLNDARAYSNNLTIYYDKSPQQGGKVRLVVAE